MWNLFPGDMATDDLLIQHEAAPADRIITVSPTVIPQMKPMI